MRDSNDGISGRHKHLRSIVDYELGVRRVFGRDNGARRHAKRSRGVSYLRPKTRDHLHLIRATTTAPDTGALKTISIPSGIGSVANAGCATM